MPVMAGVGSRELKSNGGALFTEEQWNAIFKSFGLSRREQEVVLCLFDDLNEYATAKRLGLAQSTVHTYIERLYRKLGVNSRTQLLLRCMGEYISQNNGNHRGRKANLSTEQMTTNSRLASTRMSNRLRRASVFTHSYLEETNNMNIRSRTFDFGFGLACMAITPMVIGTWFLNAPAVADSGHLPDPCAINALSDDCDFYTDWLNMHSRFWRKIWGQTYEHGLSVMSADPPADPASSTWSIKVWLDLGFDYSNPNLPLELLESQIVTEGELNVASSHILADVVQQYEDPDDPDSFIMHTTTMWVVAGIVTGPTDLSQPVVAALTRTHMSNTVGNELAVHHFNLLQVPQTLAEAITIAQKFFETVENQGGGIAEGGAGSVPGGGDLGQVPAPGPGVSPCWLAPGGQSMTPECCYCYMHQGVCYNGCHGLAVQVFWQCMPQDVGALLTTCSVLGCHIALKLCLLTGGQTGGLTCSPAILLCGICFVSLVYLLHRCSKLSQSAWQQCLADCDRDWLNCLQENNCPLPSP